MSMLGSITPLGERGRGSRWWLTVSAYIAGSLVGGALLGGLLGGLGSSVELASSARLLIFGVGALVALAFDLGLGGIRLPTTHRQVEEAWRTRYRGWVWGLAFGFQLALGVVTVVTSSMVYLTWLAALLAGSARAGVVIGAAFGLARALPVLSVGRVHSPAQVLGVDAVLRRLAPAAHGLTIVAGGAVAVVAFAGAIR
jgi:sulfite exporter TauE/SafE